MEEYLKIGVITAPHGVKGEVKVFPSTDDLARFKELKEVYLQKGGSRVRCAVTGVKTTGGFAVLKLSGIDTRDEAETYRTVELYVDRAHAVSLDEDEYYIADIIGMEVYLDTSDELFGVVREVLETGANDVYILDTKEHGEVLVPAIADCILSVDVTANRMEIHLLEGLIE